MAVLKNKLVYVLHNVETGGVEVALIDSIKHLNNEFDLFIYVIGKINNPELGSAVREFKYYEQNTLNFFNIKNVISGLFTVIKFQPDLIIYSLWRSYALSLLHSILLPTVIKVRFYHNTKFFNFADRFFSVLTIYLSKYIFVDSKSTRLFIEHFTRKKKQMFEIAMLSGDVFETKNKYPKEINSKVISVVFAGRFNSNKRIIESIDLFSGLVKRGFKINFLLYGRDAGFLNIVNMHILKQNLNFVKLMGDYNKRDQEILFKNVNFIISYSYNEGFAMSIAEAMHLGIVPIVYPAGEISNYAINDFNCIYLSGEIEQDKIILINFFNKCLDNNYYYRDLSLNASNTFISFPRYKDSLIQSIRAILNT
jgi:glycosyltransferase involved in cell wall biosynthesis